MLHKRSTQPGIKHSMSAVLLLPSLLTVSREEMTFVSLWPVTEQVETDYWQEVTGTSHFQMYPGALDRQQPGLRALSHSSEKCLKVCVGENIRRTCECREKFVCLFTSDFLLFQCLYLGTITTTAARTGDSEHIADWSVFMQICFWCVIAQWFLHWHVAALVGSKGWII